MSEIPRRSNCLNSFDVPMLIPVRSLGEGTLSVLASNSFRGVAAGGVEDPDPVSVQGVDVPFEVGVD